MEFFRSAIGVLQTLVIALGGGLAVWGGINLMEGYGQDKVMRWREVCAPLKCQERQRKTGCFSTSGLWRLHDGAFFRRPSASVRQKTVCSGH